MWSQCNSIDQEYHCFETQTQVWIELKDGYTDDFLDYLVELFTQGEEAVKDVLRGTEGYTDLPEYCP